MKKTIFLLTIAIFSGMMLFAQSKKSSIEVLYFKANLACCKAKACNVLESDIQNIITKNYPDGSVKFTEVKLVDVANKDLIDKYNAKSQTVIIVKKTKKKETFVDVSDLV
ncbi:MAG: hypothetical protein AUJ97_06420 [Bacteroidetes bacterium CG2_30_32_10]|nr:MAG: hypothetical protein AUJ97_06420 [Bacteroidetes bacterium CG2_30_32_10]